VTNNTPLTFDKVTALYNSLIGGGNKNEAEEELKHSEPEEEEEPYSPNEIKMMYILN
jgi:hypothetical protein